MTTYLVAATEPTGTGGQFLTIPEAAAALAPDLPPAVVEWGEVEGTLSNQTDLQNALNAKGTSNFDGAYASLTGKPTLFDGVYASLTSKPTLGTAAATAIGDYATAAQGTLAGTAIQAAGMTKAAVGLGSADNTADSAKPVSTATQAALDGKQIAGSYATAAQGTKADSALQPAGNGSALTGLTKAQVGLGNADNTADSAKPVSTAQQTALNLKANTSALAPVATSGVYNDLTGKPTLGSAAATASSDYATAAQGVDARTPLAHKTSHQDGGSDELALDASQVTTGQLAMARIASGTPTGAKFVRDDGTLAVPPSGSFAMTTVEVNLGATPVWQGRFTITDAAITSGSKLVVIQAPGPYTGKGTRADECEMDQVTCIATPATGTASVYWRSLAGFRPFIAPAQGRGQGLGVVGGAATLLAPPQDDQYARANLSVAGRLKGNMKFSYSVAA